MRSLRNACEHAGRAHQDRAIQTHQKIEDPASPGFNTRGLATRAAIPVISLARSMGAGLQIQVVECDARGPKLDRGVELFRCADQQVQLRLAGFGVRQDAGARYAAGCA